MDNPTGADRDVYDDFRGPELNPARWSVRTVERPHEAVWRYEDPGARITVGEGVLEIAALAFRRGHDSVQNLDNAKVLILSTQTFAVPADGGLIVEVEVSATKFGGGGADLRDGFAALNVVDLDSGLVLDLAASGERHGAIYERLTFRSPDPFLYVVDAPVTAPPTTPGQWHRFSIELDAAAQSASWRIDGVCVFTIQRLAVVPSAVRIGPGLLTLRPLGPGGSTSVRGQGVLGRWRDFRTATFGAGASPA